jgi:hypothetical protein
VVESETFCGREGNPSRGRRVISSGRGADSSSHPKDDGRGVLPWVAAGVRIDSDEGGRPCDQSGLLAQLPYHGLLHGFAQLHESAGKSPTAPERGPGPLDEKDPVPRDPNRVDA